MKGLGVGSTPLPTGGSGRRWKRIAPSGGGGGGGGGTTTLGVASVGSNAAGPGKTSVGQRNGGPARTGSLRHPKLMRSHPDDSRATAGEAPGLVMSTICGSQVDAFLPWTLRPLHAKSLCSRGTRKKG